MLYDIGARITSLLSYVVILSTDVPEPTDSVSAFADWGRRFRTWLHNKKKDDYSF